MEVQSWWATLTAQQQDQFIKMQPIAAGNTQGVPFAERIKANGINARIELERMRRRKSPEEQYGPSRRVLIGPDTGAQDADDGDPAKVSYLEAVAAGEINLAAYDPAKHSIIEVVGQLGPHTKNIITYVPGSFTNDTSFFKHQVQGLAQYLVKGEAAGETAAFIYKGGEFPDGSVPDGLLEARGDSFLIANAPKLAAFQAAIDAENTQIGAKTSNISHSWGTRLTSGAEAMGAHYDQVIALSGAALDPHWKPQLGTEYLSMSYPDPLQTAEQLGVVGINYPMKDPNFEHRWYRPPNGSNWGAPFNTENHNLIVSTENKNEPVLRDLLQKIQISALKAAA
ncbi:hypothetical protein [Psychromicrobium sp. YIM B11713]|uniref:hypothetical protein n=1 Tax=Psychromicrobium sp. YIM B11713 TaxID=3145233 RepID=UPI00374EE165